MIRHYSSVTPSPSVFAMGCCWYCSRQTGETQRFCDKSCAAAFDDDEMAMERRMLQHEERVALSA